MYKSLAAIN